MTSSPPSEPQKIPVNRTLVGVIAIACLCTGAGLWITYPSDESWRLWIGGFNRAGLFMSAIWLALPSKSRDAAWANISLPALGGCLLGLLAVVRYPRMIIPVIVVVGAVGFLMRFLGGKRGSSSTRVRPDRDSWK